MEIKMSAISKIDSDFTETHNNRYNKKSENFKTFEEIAQEFSILIDNKFTILNSDNSLSNFAGMFLNLNKISMVFKTNNHFQKFLNTHGLSDIIAIY